MIDTTIEQDLDLQLTDIRYEPQDNDNAERLITDYGEDFKYCNALGGWLHWTGSRWTIDNAAIWDAAKRLGKEMRVEATTIANRKDSDTYWKRAQYALSKAGLQRMVELAETDSRVIVGPKLFDADPYLLNVYNGTMDLRTGEKRDHARNDLLTKLAPVAYFPTAKAPEWNKFIRRVLPHGAVRRYVRKAVGNALTGAIEQQAFYLNHGEGDNGKSTFFDTLLKLFGDYGDTLDIDVLMESSKSGNATPELANLKGKRFVVSSENSEYQKLNEGRIKRLTGNATINARHLYCEPMTFDRTHKLFLEVNHLPEFNGTDPAMKRRIRRIPWDVKIKPVEKDILLPKKLEKELSGILNWALTGLRNYQAEGLAPPKAVEEATEEYCDENDRIGQFIDEMCEIDKRLMLDGRPNEDLWVTVEDLYEAYKAWTGGKVYLTKPRFGKQVAQRDAINQIPKKIANKTTRIWTGITLLR
jgi:putative DNA primase/helicase